MPGEARVLQATLTLESEAPFRGPLNGIRPSFNFGGELTACEIMTDHRATREDSGIPIPVVVRLFYTTPVHDSLSPGSSFKLNAGGRVFARGEVVAYPPAV